MESTVNTININNTKALFKKGLARYNELTKTIQKLSAEKKQLKSELIQTFENTEEYRNKKYQIGETTISYNCKKVNQGLSQKFLRVALEQYMTENKVNIDSELLLNYILSKRTFTVIGDLNVKMPKIESDDDE